MIKYSVPLLALAVLLAGQPARAGVLTDARVARTAPDKLTVTWTDDDPVDVFVATEAAATITQAKPLKNDDRNGTYILSSAGTARRYFLLRDDVTGQVTTVAERVLPLERGSNFRDIGGYPAADGRHVRWGLIYRSGATPMLTDADVEQIKALGLMQLVDLRSSEERVLAPTRIDGVPYTAVGYSMAEVTKSAGASAADGSTIYRNFPTLLAPQLRIVFADLLSAAGPIAYNCSAGQDRTGFVTAMILSAFGTPRDVIITDYHLSTQYRQPLNEMPRIDVALYPGNAAASLFARYQDDPRAAVARPLKEADGTPFLAAAFDEIDRRWGSVDHYLEKVIGLDKVKIARLRQAYLQ